METSYRDALSVVEARERLGGISNATFYALINDGELRTFKLGRRRLISHQAIIDFILQKEGELAA